MENNGNTPAAHHEHIEHTVNTDTDKGNLMNAKQWIISAALVASLAVAGSATLAQDSTPAPNSPSISTHYCTHTAGLRT